MIKITFEFTEDFIRENASVEKAMEETTGGTANIMGAFVNMLGFQLLKKHIAGGKTEFVVTADNLEEKTRGIYEKEIGSICLVAALSEGDKNGNEE